MFADKVSSTVGGDIDVATTVIYPVTYMSTKRLYTGTGRGTKSGLITQPLLESIEVNSNDKNYDVASQFRTRFNY